MKITKSDLRTITIPDDVTDWKGVVDAAFKQGESYGYRQGVEDAAKLMDRECATRNKEVFGETVPESYTSIRGNAIRSLLEGTK